MGVGGSALLSISSYIIMYWNKTSWVLAALALNALAYVMTAIPKGIHINVWNCTALPQGLWLHYSVSTHHLCWVVTLCYCAYHKDWIATIFRKLSLVSCKYVVTANRICWSGRTKSCGNRRADIPEALSWSSSGSNSNTPSFNPLPIQPIVSLERVIDDLP